MSALRNKEGIWVNSDEFRREAIHFDKHGVYCTAPYGTQDYVDYWRTQHERCIDGYSVGGAKITGHHYFYLNFSRIKIETMVGNRSKKEVGFPLFWNGDYNWFWAVEIARYGMSEVEYNSLLLDVRIADLGGGLDLITGKSRRKGFSFKNSAMLANNFVNMRGTDNLVAASSSTYLYPKGTMSMMKDHLHFLDEHTEFRRNKLIDRRDHVMCGVKRKINGVEIESGRKNHVRAMSFKDDPDKGRGSDSYLIVMEEGGTFPNLIDSYEALKPATGTGLHRTGQILIHGTASKDLEGNTADFIQMFYNPERFGLLPFYNIWDEDSERSTCSFFFPDQWGKPGFFDEQGNDDVKGALKFEIDKRNKIKANSDSSALLGYVIERPFNPGEAFLISVDNDFPTIELRKRLQEISQKDDKGVEAFRKVGDAVILKQDGDKVVAEIDLVGNLSPIWRRDQDVKFREGAVVIYEHPRNDTPFGYYKIGYDPYRHDQAQDPSFASILVYKGIDDLSGGGDKIVAEYYGRPETYDKVDEICVKLAIYYNAEVMYENEVTHTKDYFKNKNLLKYLSRQPQAAIDSVIKDSKVRRVFGVHMSDKLKDTAAKFVKKWLLEVRDIDEDGKEIKNLDMIWSPGLLEELIRYTRKGNFDRVSALFCLMFAIEESPAALRKAEQDKEKLLSKLTERYNNLTHEITRNFSRF